MGAVASMSGHMSKNVTSLPIAADAPRPFGTEQVRFPVEIFYIVRTGALCARRIHLPDMEIFYD